MRETKAGFECCVLVHHTVYEKMGVRASVLKFVCGVRGRIVRKDRTDLCPELGYFESGSSCPVSAQLTYNLDVKTRTCENDIVFVLFVSRRISEPKGHVKMKASSFAGCSKTSGKSARDFDSPVRDKR